MNNNLMTDFIEIKDNFQYAINLKYDIDSEDKIRNYIMTPGAVEVIEEVVLSLSSQSTDRAKILIGPYGKGKSHLLLVILSLLKDFKLKQNDSIVKVIAEYNSKLGERIAELRKDKIKLLPVVVSSSSLDMKQILLNSLNDALHRNSLENIMPKSYFSSAIKTIDMWKIKFPATLEIFETILGTCADSLIEKLEYFDEKSYKKFMSIYPEVTSGSEFSPLASSEIDVIYSEVSSELINYGYSGIYIVYDEFSKFLEGSLNKNSALDIKLLQDMAELCNRSSVSKQIHLMLISHKDIVSYTDSLPKEKIDSWKAVAKRFKRIEINNSKKQTYHLISKIINKKNDIWEKVYKYNEKKFKSIEADLVKVGMLRNSGIDINKFIGKTYPLHPISTYILPEISERVAQNERTIFTFLSSNEKFTLLSFINDKESGGILTPDLIFDYFEDLFKKENYEHNIYKLWRSTKDICNSLEVVDDSTKSNSVDYLLCKKIIKLISLIHMVSTYEVVQPTSEMLDFVYKWDYSYKIIDKNIKFLIEKKYLRYLDSNGFYELKAVGGIDITGKINDEVIRRTSIFNLESTFEKSLRNKVVYTNKYNDENEVIRYFKIKYLKAKDYMRYDNWDFLLEKVEGNGLFISVLAETKAEIEMCKNRSKEIDNNIVVVSIPKRTGRYIKTAQRYDAISFLLSKNKTEGNDQLIEEELLFALEEERYKLNTIEEGYLDPKKGKVIYYHGSNKLLLLKKSNLNNYLSDIMSAQYYKMPLIVNEMINKNNISSIIGNARNKVIGGLIKNKISENLGLSGHGPDITIMRSTLISTGIYDGGEKITIDSKKDDKLIGVLNIIDSYILKTAVTGKISFEELYRLLTSSKHNVGLKRSLIPIYLSVIIHKYKNHIVIIKDGHELELTVSIINEINKYPNKYMVFLEAWNEEKEKYIKSLENIFSDYIESEEKEYNSFDYILKGIHRWFLYLPKFTKEFTKIYNGGDKYKKASKPSIKLRNSMRGNRFNSREFLFEKLPAMFSYDEYSLEIIDKLQVVRNDIDQYMDKLKQVIKQELVSIFADCNLNSSLYNAINDWYNNLHDITRNNKFDSGEEVVIHSHDYISNNHDKFIDIFTKKVTGLSISDWDDLKIKRFIDKVKMYKKEIDKFDKEVRKNGFKSIERNSYTISYYDKDDIEQKMSFSNNGFKSQQAEIFYDELSGLLDDYSYSLDNNEKRQVIMEIFKKYC